MQQYDKRKYVLLTRTLKTDGLKILIYSLIFKNKGKSVQKVSVVHCILPKDDLTSHKPDSRALPKAESKNFELREIL